MMYRVDEEAETLASWFNVNYPDLLATLHVASLRAGLPASVTRLASTTMVEQPSLVDTVVAVSTGVDSE
jgi:hypothetical protein